MSHWVSYKNNILKNTDMHILEKALNNLNLGLDCKIKEVSNAYGRASVDMAITNQQKRSLSLGFKVDKNKTLNLEGDFYRTGIDQQTFMDQLAQQYNKEMIIDKLNQTSMYSVTNVTTQENGEIELTVACM